MCVFGLGIQFRGHGNSPLLPVHLRKKLLTRPIPVSSGSVDLDVAVLKKQIKNECYIFERVNAGMKCVFEYVSAQSSHRASGNVPGLPMAIAPKTILSCVLECGSIWAVFGSELVIPKIGEISIS